MATTVRYIDNHGAAITEQQCSVLEGYSKITYIDNKLKKKEEFFHSRRIGDVRFLEYFLDHSENITDVMQSYSDGKTSYDMRLNGKSQNGFTQWDAEEYNRDGVLKWKGNLVYDRVGRLVMHCYFDLNSGGLLSGTKTLYNHRFPADFNEDVLARFMYNTSGDLESIGDPEMRLGDGDALTLVEFLEVASDFLWDEHPYFHSITPYLPDSSEI